MMDLIDKLLSDTLWIYTAIIGSILGAAFVAYIRTTRIGIAAYSKFDSMVDVLVNRYGLTFLKQDDDAWRKKYPYIRNKIDELEERMERIEKNG
jgi:5-bromo-4-chloroindolyl phosphate hydrolysis protein